MTVPNAALLDATETETLTTLETRIQQGLASFIEVGEALSEIRDKRLYRASFASFEDYCRERWKISRIHAHRLIESAEVMEVLPIGNRPDITTESQARELVKVPAAERPAVIRRVKASTGGKITAAAIRREVAPPTPPAPPPEPPAVVWHMPGELKTLLQIVMDHIERAPEAKRADFKASVLRGVTDLCAPVASDKPEAWGPKNAIPPLATWVTAYSASIGYPMAGEKWCDEYAKKGWAVGKVRMKDWQATVRTWRNNGWGVGTITLAPKKADAPRNYSQF